MKTLGGGPRLCFSFTLIAISPPLYVPPKTLSKPHNTLT